MSEIEETKQKEGWSFESFMRKTFKGLLDAIAGFLLKIGLTPNAVTLFGVAFSAGVAVLLALGHITWGGILMVLAAPMDALDGSMARLSGKVSNFGAFLDSVTDRYSEMIILAGLLVYFIGQSNTTAILLIFAAAVGSILVSYTKARAESLEYNAKVGILTRVERVIVLDVCLIFNIPIVALWILAILANFTALQRIFFVWKQAKHS
ncbi:MAG: CDP-alcohol phosphatidyltransferase family protein [Anaerolineaceae bacterium]|nr:CDP-alcohol phosphatidyltransferase family protein [Anaerolineaceae bacterium]